MSNASPDPATDLFTRTFSMTVTRFNMIFSFRSVADIGLQTATDSVLLESVRLSYELFHDPKYHRFFRDKEAALNAAGGLETIVKRISDNKLGAFKLGVEAASLVFAHSILDAAALDYCRVTSFVSPTSWEGFIEQRKIKLGDMKGRTYDDILRAKLEKLLKDLERQSLLVKVDRLCAVCKPPSGFSPIREYRFDRDRLEMLDRNRHEIVHVDLVDPLPSGDDDILFFMDTCNYLMELVNQRFNVKIDPYLMVKSINVAS